MHYRIRATCYAQEILNQSFIVVDPQRAVVACKDLFPGTEFVETGAGANKKDDKINHEKTPFETMPSMIIQKNRMN